MRHITSFIISKVCFYMYIAGFIIPEVYCYRTSCIRFMYSSPTQNVIKLRVEYVQLPSLSFLICVIRSRKIIYLMLPTRWLFMHYFPITNKPYILFDKFFRYINITKYIFGAISIYFSVENPWVNDKTINF